MFSFQVDKSSICSRLKQSINSSDPSNYSEEPALEIVIFRTFEVDLLNLIKNKVILCKNFNIQPSEIDRMMYWEYEYFLDEVNETVKKEKEQQDENDKKYGNMNSKSMMRSAQSNMPKMPSMSSMPKMPSMPSMPHF